VTPTRGSYPSAALLVLGVFLGSAFWWFLLSGGMSLVRSRLTPRGLTLVNRVSGVVLTLFGIGALASLAGWARRSLSA
jgi:arginine exporter protein ArgO